MPLVYVDTFDGVATFDDVGVELADTSAIRDYVRSALVEMLAAEPCGDDGFRCHANVRDASGRQVLAASLVLTLTVPA
ncbi:hypothetical protein SAMN04487843_1047 [Methylobacterium sp. ap11]|jgi:hypothetical protein|uniref:DUF6894 family protein n=1 Tax=Methylobacterium sp. ap11 TaxID=1761799 RepID=UPI0008C293FF|nr:hypothetical protein [Methylobacterium sp. ap11]SEO80033.1 hypothetical protein SAMN04487843_1047 [Methylobacterium sp. ap11]